MPNSSVSQALQGLEPAELDPLLWQCSPFGFQGSIPDLCWSGREGTSILIVVAFLLFLRLHFFFTQLGGHDLLGAEIKRL